MTVEAGTVRSKWDTRRGPPSTDPTVISRNGYTESVTLEGHGLAHAIAQNWLVEYTRRERLAANGSRNPFEASANAACAMAVAFAQAIAPFLSAAESQPTG